MPTGIYKRSDEQIKAMRANLLLGHGVNARKKATKRLRAIAANPAWRKKVSEVTKAAMHRPEVRIKHLQALDRAQEANGINFKGGNGQEPCKIITQFAPALTAKGFIQEYPVLTRGHGTGLNCPHSYKVDFGNPKTKEAIEFDGPCHRPLARQALDLKKDTVLKSLGWKVTRIKHD